MKTAARRDLIVVVLIAAASLAVRASFALSTDVFQDEMIYWWQSGSGVTFAPHPPVTALALRLGLAVLGRRVAGLRAATLLAGTAAVFMAYVLGRQMAGRRAGVWAAGLVAACPLLVALGALATPDSLLILLWLLFACVAWRATQTGSPAWWAGTGAVLAVGLYTKYMMVLAIPSVGLALLGTPQGRRALRGAAPWIALSAGFAVFAVPFLIWDGQHGWAALRYHLRGRHGLELGLRSPAIYVLAHAGALSPVLFGAVLWGCARWAVRWRRGDARGAWIVSFFAVPVLFFLAPSVLTERVMIRVHWDSMAYVVGLVGLACLLREPGVRGRALRRRRLWVGGGVGVALLFLGVVLTLCVWPGLAVAMGRRPPTRRMLGWRDLSRCVGELRADWDGPDEPFVVAESFRTILPVAFYLDAREGVYSLSHSRNRRYGLTEQLRAWGIDEARLAAECRGRDGIYVHEFRFSSHRQQEDPPDHIYRFVDELEKLDDYYVVVGGKRIKHFGLFRIRDLQPGRVDR